MIIYVSDFDLKGSGYSNIGTRLCQGLAERGHDILALGVGYDGRVHDYDFKLCPMKFSQLKIALNVLPTAQDIPIDLVIIAFDIPLQFRMMSAVGDRQGIPWFGIFAVESDPVTPAWTMGLFGLDRCFAISEFGRFELEKAGVEAQHLPIGVDLEEWKIPTIQDRRAVRQAMGFDEEFVVLTIADNQERKNLARSLEIFADFSEKHEAIYLMVTRLRSPVGWELEDYAERLGIADKFLTWERGIPQQELVNLMTAADVFLLTSKAEGLGMPILEAMAMGLPVAATDCTAIHDHLSEGRGLLIEPEYVMVDPWGNTNRYITGRKEGVAALERLQDMSFRELKFLKQRAFEYVQSRKWSDAVDVLEAAIDETLTKETKAKEEGTLTTLRGN